MGDVRRAAMAGSWYPGTKGALTAAVEACLSQAGRVRVPGRLVALISPHAGLTYSGPVAAHGYSLLKDTASRTVVLIGPAHRPDFEGVALFARGAWETPLGRVPVDDEVSELLLAGGHGILDRPEAHRREHSLEMQMPFLQYLVPDLRIVPLLMGSQSREAADALAQALTQAQAGRNVLLVASSDLSHYLTSEQAALRDAVVCAHVERFDADGLMDSLANEPNRACGGGPMVAVMKAARELGADRASLLRYADSGATSGDHARVVGYLSAALTGPL
jgi:MEMO1 family protein